MYKVKKLKPINSIKTFMLFILSAIIFTACSSGSENTTYEVVLTSEVNWTHLNPARGDKSPSAGTLWGDRNGKEATGYLLKPSENFSSPPHIHNVTYRGMVIKGLIHNDDPAAAFMWMPGGSFWTQPKGEVHITAAKGAGGLAYIEIDEGPYLVLPAAQATDSGERPVNVDTSNIVWVDTPAENGTKQAFLWGTPEKGKLNGTLLKLPAGFKGKIISDGSTLRGIVIKGEPTYKLKGKKETKSLTLGSYFGSKGGKGVHRISSKKGETVLYIRTSGKYKIIGR